MAKRAPWIVAVCFLVLPSCALADSVYSDCSSFLAAASGLEVGTIDWEAIPSGTSLPSQGITQVASPAAHEVTFPSSLIDVLGGASLVLEVNGLDSANSHVLGTDDGANRHSILSGSNLDFGLSAGVRGLCIEVVSADSPGGTLRDGDLELTLGATTAALGIVDRTYLGTAQLVGGGSQDVYAYQLGVLADAPISTARLRSSVAAPSAGFGYFVDELTVVPEPAGIGGLTSVCVGLACLARFRRSKSPVADRPSNQRGRR